MMVWLIICNDLADYIEQEIIIDLYWNGYS
jgi:hypothetical protein